MSKSYLHEEQDRKQREFTIITMPIRWCSDLKQSKGTWAFSHKKKKQVFNFEAIKIENNTNAVRKGKEKEKN